MLCDKLTLLMPTSIDRLPYFRANLRHLEEQGFDGQLMVLDWGSKRLDEMGLWSGNAPFSVSYRYYGPEMPFHKRMLDGASRVDSPYVLFCPDDDFFFIDTLNACVRFLEGNRDFAAAQGAIFKVEVIKERNAGTPKSTYRPVTVIECLQSTPLERLHFLARNYCHWIYCVQRKETMLERLENGARFANNPVFWEYYDSLFTAAKGKTKLIPSIGVVRSSHDMNTFEVLRKSRSQDCFPFALLDRAFSEKLAQFREELGNALAANGQIVDEATRKVLEDAADGVIRWTLAALRDKESQSMFDAYDGLMADLLKRNDEGSKLMKTRQLMIEAGLIQYAESDQAEGWSFDIRND